MLDIELANLSRTFRAASGTLLLGLFVSTIIIAVSGFLAAIFQAATTIVDASLSHTAKLIGALFAVFILWQRVYQSMIDLLEVILR
ncbi:MAG TPA: flagellar biosynthetic protein FliQ [Oligoflexia bacterium]|nr:flagellar biosynthetic protein FliQ [Oligoflexia bacterium]HMP26647.1 flagellar biosynthetic protein FliQ [Oligoflexia bacterium]